MSNLAMMMGLGSGAGGVDIASAFSTDIYTGNGSTQDVVNGLDLSTDGGIVWFARRNGAEQKNLFNTTSAQPYYYLRTTTNAALTTNITTALTSFNTDGFSTGNWNNINGNGDTMVAWSFKKEPKFFTVLNYTGDGTNPRTVSHDLGAEVGMMIVKNTSLSSTSWRIYHRSTGATKVGFWPTTDSINTSSSYWADTEPTSTEFTVANNNDVNRIGDNYLALLFAHDDVIQCGSYTGTGSAGNAVDVGFQPQWLLIKQTNGANDWFIWDAKRGSDSLNTGNDATLIPNKTNAEATGADYLDFTSTGFTLNLTGGATNGSGSTYIYMAIKAED